ncbi:MAG: glycosyltransferase [Thermoproteota archaeon]
MSRRACNPEISIVVLNYNGMRFLETCLKSLLSSTYKNFEIVIVDNASKDGSVEYLKKKYSNNEKVKIIQLDRNYGFAEGNNIGYRYTHPNSKFILFLNNDTEMIRRLKKIV